MINIPKMKLLIIVSVLISVVSCAKFPSDIPRCNAGDTKCIEKAVTEVIGKYSSGHSGLYLPTIDPLHFDKLDIVENGDRPVNLKLYFKNIDFFGFKEAKATNVIGFERDPVKSKFEIAVDVPRFEMIADYEVDGRILVLPIVGKGKSNITFINNRIAAKFQATTLQKNGKTYVQLGDKFKMNFESKRIHSHLDNLFNGDKTLSDNMNMFLNENWFELYKELRPAFSEALKQVLKVYVNRIFQKLSYDDIWLDGNV